MKKLITIICFICLAGGVAEAQDTTKTQAMGMGGMKMRDRVHKEDHVMMMNGKLYQMKEGIRTEVSSPIKLNDGTMLNTDGTYERDGVKHKLSEGECLDMNGYRYKNKTMFNKRRMMMDDGMQNRPKNKTPKQPGNSPG